MPFTPDVANSVVPMVLVTPFLGGAGGDMKDLLVVIAKAAIFIALAIAAARWLVPWLLHIVVATRKREVWYYRVRPKDGTDYGPAEVSNPIFIDNSPPVANAGPDQRIAPTQAVVLVTLDGTGSQDVDGYLLDYTWSEGATVLSRGARVNVELPVGQHTLTLTVGDGEGTSTDEVLIDIPDPKPTVTAPADFTVERS